MGCIHCRNVVLPSGTNHDSAGHEYVLLSTLAILRLTLFIDYAIVIIGAVFLFATVSWIVSASKWFHGPIRNVTTDDSTTPVDEKNLSESE